MYMYIIFFEQHLVKDQRVLKLVQRLAASEDGGKDGKGGSTQQSADDWDELTAYVSCTPSHTNTPIHTCIYKLD